MTRAIIAETAVEGEGAAARDLAGRVRAGLGGETPDALLVFAPPRYAFGELLAAIEQSCEPGAMIGRSSPGGFNPDGYFEDRLCAVALKAPEMRFAAGIGRGLREDAS